MATSIYDLPPFAGFPKEGLEFLSGLVENNDRDWFEARRSVYEDQLRFPLKCLVADVARRLEETDVPLTGHPNTSRFRIYRDMRFTDDSRPYKTNLGAVFDRSGEKEKEGVVYVHIEPGASFLAAGFYKPSVSYLKPVREEMAARPEGFHQMLDEMENRDLPVTSMQDTLTGMPRGFSDYREEEIATYLKWKNLIVRRSQSDDDVASPQLAERVVQFGTESMPLFEYVWDVEEAASNETG